MVFDKTGTLTKGPFRVTKLAPVEGSSESSLLLNTATAEQYSSHPIALSVLSAWKEKNVKELAKVEDAQEIMEKLRKNTYHASGVKCLNSLDAYLDNLKKRMLHLMEIKEYDKRMEFMDSNIRIITGLIMQEMQNYIYNESMYLVKVETNLTHRVKILISGMAVLLLATLGILMR